MIKTEIFYLTSRLKITFNLIHFINYRFNLFAKKAKTETKILWDLYYYALCA